MSRLLTTALLLLASGPAFAQPRQIHWSGSFNQAVAQSKQTRKPLMIYIHGYSSERLVNEADIENDQRKAFQDPTVVALADRATPRVPLEKAARWRSRAKPLPARAIRRRARQAGCRSWSA